MQTPLHGHEWASEMDSNDAPSRRERDCKTPLSCALLLLCIVPCVGIRPDRASSGRGPREDSPSFFMLVGVNFSFVIISGVVGLSRLACINKYGPLCLVGFLSRISPRRTKPSTYYIITVQCTIVDHEASFLSSASRIYCPLTCNKCIKD
ncbi:hypothetical protein F4678DRAFT_75931 [Xylaria arbuscula]|nr:hypothetical protein F4678DRAFT_75931 [Xylaria arbuscula]